MSADIQQSTAIENGLALRRAFANFPTGVVAVAALVEGQFEGLAMSSFTSVSLRPPLVSIAVLSTSKTWPVLRRAPHLGITVLAAHHGPLVRQLAGPAEGRFRDVDVRVDTDGAVQVVDGVAYFVAKIVSEKPAGDHLLVLLEVVRLENPSASSPLVFHLSDFTRTFEGARAAPESARTANAE